MGLQSTKYHIMTVIWRPKARRASHINWEIQMDGPPDDISICICKTPAPWLKEITDLKRRMGPPVKHINLSRNRRKKSITHSGGHFACKLGCGGPQPLYGGMFITQITSIY
jgi:hypothetical protein